MIAAQLLAYYFTELKDDQVKKVSAFLVSCFFRICLSCCVCPCVFMCETERKKLK